MPGRHLMCYATHGLGIIILFDSYTNVSFLIPTLTKILIIWIFKTCDPNPEHKGWYDASTCQTLVNELSFIANENCAWPEYMLLTGIHICCFRVMSGAKNHENAEVLVQCFPLQHYKLSPGYTINPLCAIFVEQMLWPQNGPWLGVLEIPRIANMAHICILLRLGNCWFCTCTAIWVSKIHAIHLKPQQDSITKQCA